MRIKKYVMYKGHSNWTQQLLLNMQQYIFIRREANNNFIMCDTFMQEKSTKNV